MDPAQNPYTPGAGTRPPALVGRDKDLESFGVTLDRLAAGTGGRSVILHGLRGVGKTVLLGEFESIARERAWVTSDRLECHEGDELIPTIARVCQHTLRRLSRGKKISHAVERAFGVLRAFTMSLDDTGKWRFNIDFDAIKGVADSGDPETDIVELLSEVGEAASEAGSGVCLFLDELQMLSKDDLAILAASMHRISQERKPVLLAAAGLPQLPLELLEAKPYAERLFDYRPIEDLSRSTAARALVVPAERAGVKYDKDALDLILDHAGGYAYFLQQWGETVWDEAAGDDRITIDDARAGEEVVNDQLDSRFFRDRYDKATEAERIYMAAIADLGDGPHTSGDIATHMKREQKALSVARSSLLEKGLIFSGADSRLDFTVPQFAAYMRRTHPFNPDETPRKGRPRS